MLHELEPVEPVSVAAEVASLTDGALDAEIDAMAGDKIGRVALDGTGWPVLRATIEQEIDRRARLLAAQAVEEEVESRARRLAADLVEVRLSEFEVGEVGTATADAEAETEQ